MDLELVKMLLNAGVPAVFVVALIVTQSRQRSASKPADEKLETAPTYFQLDALLQDVRRVSDRLNANHDAMMVAIHDVHKELLRLKKEA